MKKCTLVFLVKPKEKKILLAMKKRGFGVGKWNGVGGKLQGEETVKQAAIREAQEEIGVEMKENDLQEVAVNDFFFENKSEFDQQVHVFLSENWQGEPVESEEMKPQWYSYSEMPLNEMWASDTNWLPRVLNGEKIKGKITFDNTGAKLLNIELQKTA